MPLPWTQSSPVTIAADGTGEVAIWAPGVDLVITQQTVSVTTDPAHPGVVPTAKVYRDIVSDAAFIEGSFTGNNDSSASRIVLRAGEGLICVWSDASPGTRATYRIAGVHYPPGTAPLA